MPVCYVPGASSYPAFALFTWVRAKLGEAITYSGPCSQTPSFKRAWEHAPPRLSSYQPQCASFLSINRFRSSVLRSKMFPNA